MLDPADIARLLTPDAMAAVLANYASPRGTCHGKPRYTCPLHAHKHPDKPHLRIDTGKDGRAIAICDTYGVMGDIFSLIGQVQGITDYIGQVHAAADALGYRLAEDTPRRPRGTRKHTRIISASGTPAAPRIAPPAGGKPSTGTDAPQYLPPDDARAAWQAVDRLAANPAAIARHAAALGLPEDVIAVHACRAAAALGMLGTDDAGRLVYVYTDRDPDGAWQVPLAKFRGMPGEVPRFRARGRKCGLWGAACIGQARRVIITEGESDALAVRAAVWAWVDAWAHCDPGSYDADAMPAILAKPDAGTFRAAWAAPLVGRDIIICTDADDAGQAGARTTAALLHGAGVRRVWQWTPPAPHKDARAALDAVRPSRLAEDIMTRKTLL